MRGIILAGGKGTRLLPATKVTNKHLIPILNKPMIEYPIGTLIALGCTDVLVVTGGEHIGDIASYLGDGSDRGLKFSYKVQPDAGGIAQALALAEDFAHGESIAVILGDNVFDNKILEETDFQDGECHLFIKRVKNPSRFGVISPNPDGGYIIEEKPKNPKSDNAVTGLYVFPADVFGIIREQKPSARGEMEITDVNNAYVSMKKCVAHNIGQAFWSDAGTPESLYEVVCWAFKNGNM
jgi:glucose-1-phosphate thymidylyltransferase